MSWLVLIISGVLEAVWATALGRSEGFTKVGPTVVFGVALAASMGGLAYAMSGRAARLTDAVLQERDLLPLAPEDLTIARTVFDLCGDDRVRLVSPWTPSNRAGRWCTSMAI